MGTRPCSLGPGGRVAATGVNIPGARAEGSPSVSSDRDMLEVEAECRSNRSGEKTYAKSLRTRNSFETGIFQLGGHANYLDTNAVYTPAVKGAEQAFATERLDDVAKLLSRYGEAICIRIFGDPVGWVYGAGNHTTCASSPRPPTCRSSTWKTTCTTPARAWPTL
ncbi:MAG: hypothetical protein NTW58_04940 [Actinobacteria bacterium]|nr:hypothetical protein [Actinomycetota bacterium]